MDNNYTLFVEGDYEEPGKGHNGFFTERDTTFIVNHAYTRWLAAGFRFKIPNPCTLVTMVGQHLSAPKK